MSYNPNSGGGASWGSVTGTLADQTDLQSALDAKAASSHTHSKSDINSAGTWAASEIPSLDTSKVTTGTFDEARIPTLAQSKVTNLTTDLANKLNITAFSGLTKISVGTGTPSSPSTGDLWIDTN